MIRTLIVDDERWVCQLIRRLVNWSALGFSIIGESHDGNEAFEQILKEKPDLVLTDIRMPGQDGLSIIQSVKVTGQLTKFIVVSGYSDFEYAKNALNYGALGYLLKPIDKKELSELLISIRESIFSQRVKAMVDEQIKDKLSYSLNRLKEKYFIDFLTGESGRLAEVDIGKINTEFESTFKPGKYQVIVYKPDFRGLDKLQGTVEKVLFEKMQNELTSIYVSYCADLSVVRIKSHLAVVLNFHSTREIEIGKLISKSMTKLRDNISLMRDFDLTIGIGRIGTHLNDIPESYRFAVEAVKARILYGINRVIDLGSRVFDLTELESVFPVADKLQLTRRLESIDYQGASEIVDNMIARFDANRDLSPNLFEIAINQVQKIFVDCVKRSGTRFEQSLDCKDMLDKDLEDFHSLDQIRKYFHFLFERANNTCEKLKSSQNSQAIECVKHYISTHYKDEITLSDVAKIAYLNTNYLGDLFKKETGINFSEYLIEFRINVAKDLMKDLKLRISDVAEQVGYPDAKYFSKLFKKIVGVSPADYRKMFV